MNFILCKVHYYNRKAYLQLLKVKKTRSLVIIIWTDNLQFAYSCAPRTSGSYDLKIGQSSFVAYEWHISYEFYLYSGKYTDVWLCIGLSVYFRVHSTHGCAIICVFLHSTISQEILLFFFIIQTIWWRCWMWSLHWNVNFIRFRLIGNELRTYTQTTKK